MVSAGLVSKQPQLVTKGTSVSGKELVECVQWDWHKGQLSVEMLCLVEKANSWKCRCDACKENKGQFVGMAWSERILSFVSDIARVGTFLSACPISTDFPTYTVKQCCLLGTNRMETLKMDTVQEAAAVDTHKKKKSAGMPSPRPQDDRGHHLIHMGVLAC